MWRKANSYQFYDAATEGNLLWQEAHSSVTVQKGLFSVILGSTAPLNLAFDKQYYLSIQVGADPEMSPRQQLASAPYAFRAANTDAYLASVFKKFGGDGSDGSRVVSGTENWNSTPRQFSSLTINPEARVNVTDKIVIIGVSGDCTIAGTINANGQGASGGGPLDDSQGEHGQRADFCPATPTRDFGEISKGPLAFCLGGAGGGGGGTSNYRGANGGGAGGSGGSGGTTSNGGPAQYTPLWKVNSLAEVSKNILLATFLNSFGAGGGGGGGECTRAGRGGSGGGVIYIEVGGFLTFTGTCSSNGINGNDTSVSAAGGGGGGGGGCIVLRARKISNQNGTLSINGGIGGVGCGGGTGGNGAAGYGAVLLVD